MPDFPKNAFTNHRSQGYKLLYYHAGTLNGQPARVGYLVGRNLPPVWAMKYKAYQAHGATFRQAVAKLRAKLPPSALVVVKN